MNKKQEKLITDNIKYAKTIADNFIRNTSVLFHADDIVSSAYLGLTVAAKNFDDLKNVKFRTYAAIKIISEIWERRYTVIDQELKLGQK